MEFNSPNSENGKHETTRVPGEKPRKFERPVKGILLLGVCRGVSSYFGLSVIIIRFLFVAGAFVSGVSLVAYLVLLAIMPLELPGEEDSELELKRIRTNNIKSVSGTLLLFAGLFFIVKNSGLNDLFWFSDFSSSYYLSLFVIGGGIVFLRKEYSLPLKWEKLPLELKKSNVDKRLTGLCGGFANYTNIDATIVRMTWIFSSFATLGITVLIYIALSLYLPNDNKSIIDYE